jgi:hypothetical protein
MKIRWSCLLLVLWGGAGCIDVGVRPEEKPAPVVPIQAAKPKRPPAPVTADEVTESNVRDKFKALQAELDREQQGDAADGDEARP